MNKPLYQRIFFDYRYENAMDQFILVGILKICALINDTFKSGHIETLTKRAANMVFDPLKLILMLMVLIADPKLCVAEPGDNRYMGTGTCSLFIIYR